MSKRWNPETVAAPVGRYSHLAQIPADHELVVVAGQIGARPDGTLAGPDAEAQTREALANIERVLAAAGAGPEHLVKVFSMVSRHRASARFSRRDRRRVQPVVPGERLADAVADRGVRAGETGAGRGNRGDGRGAPMIRSPERQDAR